MISAMIMPNHVHALFVQNQGWPLEKIVQSWKRFTARQSICYATGLEGSGNEITLNVLSAMRSILRIASVTSAAIRRKRIERARIILYENEIARAFAETRSGDFQIAPPWSNHRVKRLEVGIYFRQIAEGTIHLEADLQVLVCVADIAEERFVAAHVVIINGLLQQRDRAGGQDFFRLGRFAELMQAKPGMEKPGAGIGGGAAKLPADAEGEGPLLFAHEVMKAKVKHFRAILKARGNRVEFSERFSRHA